MGPTDISKSVAKAKVVASAVATLPLKGEVTLELTAVNKRRCMGCRVCIEAYPYGAIELADVLGAEAQFFWRTSALPC